MPWKPWEALAAFFLAWIGAPLAILLVVKFLAPYVPLLNSFRPAFKVGDITSSFIFAVVNAIASLAIIGFYLYRYHAGWSSVGWRKFNLFKAVLYVIVGLIVFAMAVYVAFLLVSWLFPTFNATQPQTNDFIKPQTSTARQLSLIALVIIPPIVEETVFRGFIFPAMSKLGGTLVGAIVTSFLFGLAHLQLNVSLYTIVFSLILCFMYVRLRSIWPGVILHMINNYLAYATILKK